MILVTHARGGAGPLNIGAPIYLPFWHRPCELHPLMLISRYREVSSIYAPDGNFAHSKFKRNYSPFANNFKSCNLRLKHLLLKSCLKYSMGGGGPKFLFPEKAVISLITYIKIIKIKNLIIDPLTNDDHLSPVYVHCMRISILIPHSRLNSLELWYLRVCVVNK